MAAATPPSSGPPGPVPEIKKGERILEKFVVRKRLNEGSCGYVYLVESVKSRQAKYAMKVEPRQKSKDEEILRMELYVLRKMQGSRHVPRFYGSGTNKNYSFIVMTLFDKDLYELRRRCKGRKVSHESTLRLALQGVQALEDLHTAGFVHRDMKPGNLMMGLTLKSILYLMDFGLCRQILLPGKDGKMALREPRARVAFRGTVRYCSLNVHQNKEQGRHDDLFGLLYTMIETTSGSLPWKGSIRAVTEKLKIDTPESVLLKDSPPSFTDFLSCIKNLTYHDTPPYQKIKEILAKNIHALGVKMTDPYDWERSDRVVEAKTKVEKTIRENAVKETGGDNGTSRDIDESVCSKSTDNTDEEGCDAEDTLDQAPAEMKAEPDKSGKE